MPIVRKTTSPAGKVAAIAAPNARQTYTPTTVKAPGVSAKFGANVPAILAPNARQTHFIR